jgi:hypothetical protein
MKKFLIVGGSPGKQKKLLARANFLEAKIPGSVYLYSCNLHSFPPKQLEFFRSHTGSLALTDVKPIQDLVKEIGLALIGPDLGHDFDGKKALLGLVNLDIPLIIEDDALVPELLKVYNPEKNLWLLVLEEKQFEFLFKERFSDKNLEKITQDYKINLYCSGKYFTHQENYFTPVKDFKDNKDLVAARIAYHLKSR